MPDPALQKSLVELAAVLKRLNEASDALNARIVEFEVSLMKLNPGIMVMSRPFRVDEAAELISMLCFMKWDEKWGLYVVRMKAEQLDGEWQPVDDADWEKTLRLVDATREERAASLDVFPEIVEEMTKSAKDRLARIEAASKRAK